MIEKVEILVASAAGFCFGVERAINLSEKALIGNANGSPVMSLGPLIHNPQVVEEMKLRGLSIAEKESDLESGTVIFRSHGVRKDLQERIQARGLKAVDATCPLVKVPQNFAKKLSESGYYVIIVGDKDHPEIQGVQSYVAGERFAVIKDASQLPALPPTEKVGIICQTTLKKKILDEVVTQCQQRFSEVKLHNTICSATKERQEAATDLAARVDCMVIIGGKNSSNTQKLFDICAELAPTAYLIESDSELKQEWFIGHRKIGITAGASTPPWLIAKVKAVITEMCP